MKIARRTFAFLIGALIVVFSASAQQSYPTRPIRLIVPFPPGGGNDFVGRLVAQKLGERLGQQIVVDNRAGASGVIGTEIGARATPDGYTLLLGFVGPLALRPNLEKVPYDPVRDFTAASLIASSYHILVVHPSIPVRSVKDLIAFARARPGQLNYASSGTGANFHLIAELFKSAAGIDIVHVPYKGAAAAALAVVTGEAHMMFSSTTAVLPHIRTKRLTALAVTSPARSPLAPEVPTLVESGVRGVELGSWYAIVAPAATPREIVARLNAELVSLASVPEYRQQLEKLAFEPLTSKPEQFAGFVKGELDKWGKVIRAAGIKPE
ncbi:MAG TPA: tripartite tricarboxylate transporter substrate binding protein [Burkholderiales bacterium]|nr:tripartite tricarboxylate transporter substrate binding protein [Burkholderiales bacterium]